MSDGKDFIAEANSNARQAPVRVAFVTRRTSPAVKSRDEDLVMTYPEIFFRAAVAVMSVGIALVWIALLFNAPLEGLADPMHTPNPAKAPWYFLGLQELLHYFPPVVAGVLIPGMVVTGLIVIPYFNINIQAEGLWLRDRKRRLRIFGAVVAVLVIFLAVFDVWVALIPTVVIAALMLSAAYQAAHPEKERKVPAKPLSFWIMTWFLTEAIVLTAVGTFFRGPGWSWVWPWR
jgi:quinol-cytochrome oxidoreductase complex cytochrome b subunit